MNFYQNPLIPLDQFLETYQVRFWSNLLSKKNQTLKTFLKSTWQPSYFDMGNIQCIVSILK